MLKTCIIAFLRLIFFFLNKSKVNIRLRVKYVYFSAVYTGRFPNLSKLTNFSICWLSPIYDDELVSIFMHIDLLAYLG